MNADPDTDPDPAFFLIADPESGSAIRKRTLKLQEKPSAVKREHPVLKNMKILDFFLFLCGSFLPSWIRIRIQQLKLMRIHVLELPIACLL
jgi:hypothetical protein